MFNSILFTLDIMNKHEGVGLTNRLTHTHHSHRNGGMMRSRDTRLLLLSFLVICCCHVSFSINFWNHRHSRSFTVWQRAKTILTAFECAAHNQFSVILLLHNYGRDELVSKFETQSCSKCTPKATEKPLSSIAAILQMRPPSIYSTCASCVITTGKMPGMRIRVGRKCLHIPCVCVCVSRRTIRLTGSTQINSLLWFPLNLESCAA